MRTWWVNQNQTYRQELGGGYLWSPKRKSNGARNHFYDTMREVAPGDIVFSYHGTLIAALGRVLSYCYESPKPIEFGSAGLNWEAIGWRVDVSWQTLRVQIRPRAMIDRVKPLLPVRYSPIRAETGYGLQSVYLAEIPFALASLFAAEIGQEAWSMFDGARAWAAEEVAREPAALAHLREDWEERLVGRIDSDNSLDRGRRLALIRSRRGEGIYREKVCSIESMCRVTKVKNRTHLVARHCKPWRHSNNEERLDGENGLLFTPSIDHLFDRGFISFEDNGTLLISPVADREAISRMGVPIEAGVNVGGFSRGQKMFMNYHRSEVFLDSGR